MSTDIRVFDDHRCLLGEGPRWIDGALVWVDIRAGLIFRRRPDGPRQQIDLGQSVGFVATDEAGRLIAGLREGVAFVGFERAEQTTPIARWLNRSMAEDADRRCNDGAAGPDGRLWVGTMLDTQDTGTGDLRRLGADGEMKIVRTGLTVPNGLAWSADGRRMYHIDSPRRVIEVLEFDAETGRVGEVVDRIQTPDSMGYPDGMTIDDQGTLWVAHWAGGCVSRWDPVSRTLLERIEVPVSNVTACSFGGPDLDRLYITSAQDDSHTGGETFVCSPGARGSRSYRLNGLA